MHVYFRIKNVCRYEYLSFTRLSLGYLNSYEHLLLLVCLFLCVADLKIDSTDIWFEQSKYEAAYEQYAIATYYAGSDKIIARIDALEKQNADLKSCKGYVLMP